MFSLPTFLFACRNCNRGQGRPFVWGSLFTGFPSATREVIAELKKRMEEQDYNKSKGEAVTNWCTTKEFVKGGPWSAALQ